MLLEEVLTEISIPIHPFTYSFWAFKPVYTKAFKRCDYKFKIGALRILLSENTFAGHCCRLYGKHWEMSEIINLPRIWLRTKRHFLSNQFTHFPLLPLFFCPHHHHCCGELLETSLPHQARLAAYPAWKCFEVVETLCVFRSNLANLLSGCLKR